EIAHSVIRVIGFVGTHEGRVALEAKARIADRVLPRQLYAPDLGRGAVDLRSDTEIRQRAVGQRHPIDGLYNGATHDEVGDFLHEYVGRRVGVRRVVPFHCEIQIVGQVWQQGRIAAGTIQRSHTLTRRHIEIRRDVGQKRTGQSARGVETHFE